MSGHGLASKCGIPSGSSHASCQRLRPAAYEISIHEERTVGFPNARPLRLSRPRGEERVGCSPGAAVRVVSCENPLSPELCGAIPDQTIAVGGTIDVDLCFRDPAGEALDFEAFSSDPDIAHRDST